MTASSPRRIVVCQIGAREHYAVPRILHREGMLAELITDAWVPPHSVWARMPGQAGARLRGRYDPGLGAAQVTAFTAGHILRQACDMSREPWEKMISQNDWFQRRAVYRLRQLFGARKENPAVLAYSYAAREIFREARQAGALTILAQIDGGEADESLINRVLAEKRRSRSGHNAPPEYWRRWREECELAHRIVVNSEWSRELLVEAGVEREKLAVVPVISEGYAGGEVRSSPARFDATRPLEVLCLGGITVRKGTLDAVDAARLLRDQPVHFTFVGPDPEGNAALLRAEPNITCHGSVPRSEVWDWMRKADVFLFPSHSDGFGISQMEALHAGLPIIASRNCARLVEHGRTGRLLEEVSGSAIAGAIRWFLHYPEKIHGMSAAALRAAEECDRDSVSTFVRTIRAYLAESCE